jgi:hypothetical protein
MDNCFEAFFFMGTGARFAGKGSRSVHGFTHTHGRQSPIRGLSLRIIANLPEASGAVIEIRTL